MKSDLKPLTRWRKFRRVLAFLNLALVLALMWLAWRIGESWWLATLIIYPPQQGILVSTCLLICLSIWKREKLEFRCNALSLLLGVFGILGFQIPLPNWLSPAISPHSNSQLRKVRVMSFNILGGGLGIENVAQTIRAQNPDIVCLQEAATYGTSTSFFTDATPKLQRLLPGYFMARAREVTTFSRFPIVQSRDVPSGGFPGRAFLETIIEIDGRRMSVVNVHLWSVQLRGNTHWTKIPYRKNLEAANTMRGEQFALLRRVARRSGLPVVIAGDFNTPARGKFYTQMSGEFHDAFAVRGLGFGQTFPAKFPLIRIDYLWSSAGWRPVNAWTVNSPASDHRAVVADYLW